MVCFLSKRVFGAKCVGNLFGNREAKELVQFLATHSIDHITTNLDHTQLVWIHDPIHLFGDRE